jgi:hypothetical protein
VSNKQGGRANRVKSKNVERGINVESVQKSLYKIHKEGGIWQKIYPIPTKGANYNHHITIPPPPLQFTDFPKALESELKNSIHN